MGRIRGFITSNRPVNVRHCTALTNNHSKKEKRQRDYEAKTEIGVCQLTSEHKLASHFGVRIESGNSECQEQNKGKFKLYEHGNYKITYFNRKVVSPAPLPHQTPHRLAIELII